MQDQTGLTLSETKPFTPGTVHVQVVGRNLRTLSCPSSAASEAQSLRRYNVNRVQFDEGSVRWRIFNAEKVVHFVIELFVFVSWEPSLPLKTHAFTEEFGRVGARLSSESFGDRRDPSLSLFLYPFTLAGRRAERKSEKNTALPAIASAARIIRLHVIEQLVVDEEREKLPFVHGNGPILSRTRQDFAQPLSNNPTWLLVSCNHPPNRSLLGIEMSTPLSLTGGCKAAEFRKR